MKNVNWNFTLENYQNITVYYSNITFSIQTKQRNIVLLQISILEEWPLGQSTITEYSVFYG